MASDKSARQDRTQPREPSARAAALAILGEVLGQGRMLGQLAKDERVTPQNRARAERLSTDVLRQLQRLDRILKPLLRKEPPLAVMNVLRLAALEIAQGGARHGVVNEAVGHVRHNRKTQHLSGLVNAVLRAIPEDVSLDPLPPPMMPRWLRQPLVHAWGRDVVQAIEAVQTQSPPVDLTVKATASAAPEGRKLPSGSIRLASAGQLSNLPGYEEGDWWVQDAAAAMAVRLLAPQPEERILDICAAPGGKTMQLADAGAAVTALDISETRMQRVRENLSRTALPAELIVADALKWTPDTSFDAILLDAPCSATGTIRRHPDLPLLKDGSDVEGLAALQRDLLDRALGWLRPKGRLVFCTCSLLPAEGEAQLDWVLQAHPKLTVRRPELAGIDSSWVTTQGGLRLRPDYWADIGGMDGFFMFCVEMP